MLTKITTLTLSCLAAIGFSAACAAEGSYNVNQINIPEKPEFMLLSVSLRMPSPI